MPLRTCKLEELTPHPRGRQSGIDKLEELTELKAVLAHGLKPYEAVEIELPNTKIKNLRVLFRRRIIHMLKRLNLRNYKVNMYRAEGREFIAVSHVSIA